MNYNHQEVEKKWQGYWPNSKTSACDTWDFDKPKCYVLDMLPHPNGDGLHVGHSEGYTTTDIVCRMGRIWGRSALHLMDWDAFGLPAEQFTIVAGSHPAGFIEMNIDHFREQIRALGFSYGWDREASTTDPGYYK